MAPYPSVGENDFLDRQGQGLKRHLCAKLGSCDRPDPFREPFLVSDNAARDMPSRLPISVIAPRQQGLASLVLDQQVHVDHGHDPAGEQKEMLRQSSTGISNQGVDRIDGLFDSCWIRHECQFPPFTTFQEERHERFHRNVRSMAVCRSICCFSPRFSCARLVEGTYRSGELFGSSDLFILT